MTLCGEGSSAEHFEGFVGGGCDSDETARMSSTSLLLQAEDVAALESNRTATILATTSLGPVALSMTSDVRSLERRWRALQRLAPCTAAQTYSYAEAWSRLVLAPAGKTPVIVAGADASGRDLFLWAFEIDSACGQKILKWLGESHASYAMGLFLPEVARRLGASDMSSLVEHVARKAGADAAFLCAQPCDWDGVPNPFAKLPHQPSPSHGYAVRLGDFDALYRRRFSKTSRAKALRKERRLAEMGALQLGWAASERERLAVLDALFAQKARQLAELGVKNPFNAEVRSFFREMALLADDDPARLRLGYLKLNGEIAATHSGTLCHGRLAIALSSLTDGSVQRYSPGGLLLRHQIEEASAQGHAYYDLGAGAGPNKDEWCDIVHPLFDNFIPFTAQGILLTSPAAAVASLKRSIKSNRHLWPRVQRLRQGLLGRSRPKHESS
jgi:CelD/BcsL family acetyltransferase involved in cellulose biosynthesis